MCGNSQALHGLFGSAQDRLLKLDGKLFLAWIIVANKLFADIARGGNGRIGGLLVPLG